LKSLAAFATIAFNVVIELEQFELEPTALNSNLFPVKANGEVLFLSVLSKRTSEFYLRHLILNLFFSEIILPLLRLLTQLKP
jgi:hypothetical protein